MGQARSPWLDPKGLLARQMTLRLSDSATAAMRMIAVCQERQLPPSDHRPSCGHLTIGIHTQECRLTLFSRLPTTLAAPSVAPTPPRAAVPIGEKRPGRTTRSCVRRAIARAAVPARTAESDRNPRQSARSEERRVGKAWRTRWRAECGKEKNAK